MTLPRIVRTGRWLLAALLLALLAACGAAPPAAPTGAAPTPNATPVGVDNSADTLTLYVGPEMVACEGAATQSCWQIRTDPSAPYELLYEPIQGFVYEPGYEYKLRVQRVERSNPPADAASFGYSLVEVVSQTPAAATGAGDGLAGTIWQLNRYGPEEAPTPLRPLTRVTLEFGASGRLNGWTGCNGFDQVPYTLDGTSLTVDLTTINRTDLACEPETVAQEQAFLEALRTATTVERDGDALVIRYEGGALHFRADGTPSPTSEPLDGTRWQLVQLGPPNAPTALLPGSSVTAEFDAGIMGGSAGCNSYGGMYHVEGDRFATADMASTAMACEDAALMEQEAAFLGALRSVTTYRQEGDTLVLLYEGGEMRFHKTDGAANPPGTATAPLDGTRWRLASYGPDESRTPALAGVDVTAQFEGGMISGTAGCNLYSGAYHVEGDQFTVADLPRTEMACEPPEVMAQEDGYLSALQAVSSFARDQGTLTLFYEGGALRFVAIPADTALPLEGTLWALTGIGQGDTVASPVAGSMPTLTLEGGEVTGYGGCNQFSASATLAGEQLTIGPVSSTRMACEPEVMAQEQALFSALSATQRYTIDGSALTLFQPEGFLLFSPAPIR